jgi:hypothetical protein
MDSPSVGLKIATLVIIRTRLPFRQFGTFYAVPKLLLSYAQLVAKDVFPQVDTVSGSLIDGMGDFRPQYAAIGEGQLVANMITALASPAAAVRYARPTLHLAELLVVFE